MKSLSGGFFHIKPEDRIMRSGTGIVIDFNHVILMLRIPISLRERLMSVTPKNTSRFS